MTSDQSRTSLPRPEYLWTAAGHAHNHVVLLPAIRKVLGRSNERKLLDLGCGNGSLTAALHRDGFEVTGLDSAIGGIRLAQEAHPELTFMVHDVSQALPREHLKQFNVVLATEVIEHLFLPRQLFHRAIEALTDDGILVITTPYHGWLKNVALALMNRFDGHWNPGWDYGHVKFFSRRSLLGMAEESGLEMVSFHRVGRVPPLAMSMIMVLRRVS